MWGLPSIAFRLLSVLRLPGRNAHRPRVVARGMLLVFHGQLNLPGLLLLGLPELGPGLHRLGRAFQAGHARGERQQQEDGQQGLAASAQAQGQG